MKKERKNNIFTQVPVQKVKRNLFDLSHEVKMTGKFGYLYPVLCMETLPGDTIRDTMNAMIRFAPMAAPVMHRCDVTTHFFFVPNRLLTEVWEDFITGGQDGTAAPILPYITPALTGESLMRKGSLWDYVGLPVLGDAEVATSTEQISVLPFRAAAKVWNDYYRDPNLQEELSLGEELAGDVSDLASTNQCMNMNNYRRGFEKDYFTSALPWAQRGAQVLMPLSATLDGDTDIVYQTTKLARDAGFTDAPDATGNITTVAGNFNMSVAPGEPVYLKNIDSATFENASTTINDFRRALAIQRWLENNARGGARYVEQIESHFNMRVPDYRLQRAEYLGGGKQPVQISEVLATSQYEPAVGEDVYVGDMAGHGLSVGRTNTFTYRCQEHGFVVGFLSVTMRTAYSQGIAKMFSRRDKFDYAWPELANLGEQEIKSQELFFSFNDADASANEAVFGYIPRYAEYKFHNDRIAGDFRGSLSYWHLGRKFTERPSLDAALTTIYENGDGGSAVANDKEESFRRIFMVNDGTDYLWMQLYHRLTAKRPLPYFGVPQIG